jgi:hypothetical protein
MKIFITIDTEEDNWGEYKYKDAGVKNVAQIKKLQEIFNGYEAMPTYLVNYPVINDKTARNLIKSIYDNGRCEIGAHCHPWNTPPINEKHDKKNSMLCNLPYTLAFEKIANLHESIIKETGVEPKCFRAGRWGFSPGIAQCIKELGYKIDTSITPFYDWTRENGPDFSNAPYSEYRFDPNDIFKEKMDGSLLEVPPTIGFLQKNFKRCFKVRNWIIKSPLSKFRLLGILDMMNVINLRWLSPELISGNKMIHLAKNFMKNDYRFLNMSFHSTTLLPGRTPFVKNENELKRFLNNIETFLRFAKDRDIKIVPLSEALNV